MGRAYADQHDGRATWDTWSAHTAFLIFADAGILKPPIMTAGVLEIWHRLSDEMSVFRVLPLFALLFAVGATLPIAAQNHYYTTTFPGTENPICEQGTSGCVWINGLSTGLDWGDVATKPNLAYDTTISGAPPDNDSIAALTGTWTGNQTVQATVSLNNSADTSAQEEVELHLNTTIEPHNATGYELDFSVVQADPYVLIVRWNGPLNNATALTNLYPIVVHNGDVLMGTNVNGLITIYINGVKQISVTDTTYRGGSPGIGFWNEMGTTSQLSNYGFSKFTAWDDAYTGQKPSAPTNLSGTVVPR